MQNTPAPSCLRARTEEEARADDTAERLMRATMCAARGAIRPPQPLSRCLPYVASFTSPVKCLFAPYMFVDTVTSTVCSWIYCGGDVSRADTVGRVDRAR
jgi:hypothetical protein